MARPRPASPATRSRSAGVGNLAEALVGARLGDLDHQAPAAVAPVVLDVEVRRAVVRVDEGDRLPFVAGREAPGGHRGPLRLDRRDHGAHDRPGPREDPLVDALEEVLRRPRRAGEDDEGVLVDVPLLREVVDLHGMREPEARGEPARLGERVLLAVREHPRDSPQGRPPRTARILRRVVPGLVAHLAPSTSPAGPPGRAKARPTARVKSSRGSRTALGDGEPSACTNTA